jgi:hypothetical protein
MNESWYFIDAAANKEFRPRLVTPRRFPILDLEVRYGRYAQQEGLQ